MTMCKLFRSRLNAYFDGELSLKLRSKFDDHVRTCLSCQAALEKMRQLAPIMKSFSVPPVPVGLDNRIIKAARNRAISHDTLSWNPLAWWWSTSVPIRSAAAVILVAGLLIGILVGWNLPDPNLKIATVRNEENIFNVYNLDILGDVPDGSLINAYLTLVSADQKGW